MFVKQKEPNGTRFDNHWYVSSHEHARPGDQVRYLHHDGTLSSSMCSADNETYNYLPTKKDAERLVEIYNRLKGQQDNGTDKPRMGSFTHRGEFYLWEAVLTGGQEIAMTIYHRGEWFHSSCEPASEATQIEWFKEKDDRHRAEDLIDRAMDGGEAFAECYNKDAERGSLDAMFAGKHLVYDYGDDGEPQKYIGSFEDAVAYFKEAPSHGEYAAVICTALMADERYADVITVLETCMNGDDMNGQLIWDS